MEKACFGGDDTAGTDAADAATTADVASTSTTPAAVPTPATPPPATSETAPPTAVTPPPEKANSPLFILYGSATGNAEEIAKDLASTYELFLKNPDMKTFFPEVVCCELNQFKKKLLPAIETPPAPGSRNRPHTAAAHRWSGHRPGLV